MNFWQVFVRVFPWRPLAALTALWWHITRRRLRARNRLRTAGAPLPFAYQLWMRNIERPGDLENRAGRASQSWDWEPRFLVILDGSESDAEDIARSVVSVEQQAYPHWSLLIADTEKSSPALANADGQVVRPWRIALSEGSGDFIVPLRAGNQLSKLALFHFADVLQTEPTASIVYGDEDEIDAAGRRKRPWFKPRWNEELFLARDYISRACAIRLAAVREAALKLDFRSRLPVFELLLHATNELDGPIIHVPHIIAHVGQTERSPDQGASVKAVAEYLAPAGGTAAVGPFGSVKVTWPLLSELPLVSIIVPTKDKIGLLRACVESVLTRTRYQPFELLIVDNASVEPRTLSYLERVQEHAQVRVLPYPHPYNYSAINNYAAREARGSYLCLLNNDTEVVEGDWLTEMMRYAARPEIGAAGAKLLYADGTIQHAGVVVGIGDAAGHAHRNLPSHEGGYFCQAHLSHYVSAVTGACLLVEKQKFLAVGGLDEKFLPVAFNDVDFCLKLERAGWRNIYVPHAVLIHHESKSRGNDHAPSQIGRYQRELKVFQERWGTKTYDDPLLNPNLDRSSETFIIRF